MPAGESPGWNDVPWARRLLWLVALLAAGQAVGIAAWYWPGAMPDTDTSGVWVALADDVAHGDFYRPLQGPLGTGGTRYMPLFFTLHGALIKAGFAPLSAGMWLTLASAAAFVLALGWLLRRLGAPRALAWPAAVLMGGTVTFGMMTLTVRGDFLAAAANLAGVAAALAWREKGGAMRLWLAAFFFAAAFLTKLTTLFGLAAVVVWLGRDGDRRAGARLAGASLALMGAGVLAVLAASDGRWWASFRAVAPGGGDAAFALSAPWRLVVQCARDPLLCLLLVPAIGCVVWGIRDAGGALVRWLVLATLAVTLLIFASPGTSANHLLDLLALAVVVLACALGRAGGARGWAGFACGLLGLGILATWLPGVPSIPAFHRRYGVPAASAPREFAARAGPGVTPIFAENPLIPILAGERPYVADLFNLLLMMRQDPALREKITGQVRRGEFGAIVISNWPDVFPRDVTGPDDPLIAEREPALAQQDRIFDDFHAVLRERYRIVLVRRPYIYFLRDDLAFAPAP